MIEALREHTPSGLLAIEPVTGGLYLWITMRSRLDSHELLHRAEAEGVVFVPGETFYADGSGKNQLRLCYSAVPPARIDDGIATLGPLLSMQ